jgi:glycosyltransferase involved in cell wall biosynthesis
VHNLPDWLVFVSWLPKLSGARIILDLHDLMPEFYAARFNRSLNSWPVELLRWQEQLSCRFADHVITVTDGWRETLIERGVHASKISVVMNVADDRIFFCSNQIKMPNPRNGKLQLLYHGNITHRYGIDLAILAVGKTLENIPGIHLHLHGWGDARQSLVELTRDLNLEEYVSFSTQNLLTSELPNLIQQADVCLVPYRRDVFTDGILPTKLMEYAALGKTVITARTPTIARYFDETMVQFFEPGNVDDLARCILMMYHNPDLMAALARGIQNFNQSYNWSKIRAEYVALVDRLRTEGSSVED